MHVSPSPRTDSPEPADSPPSQPLVEPADPDELADLINRSRQQAIEDTAYLEEGPP